MVIHYFYIFCSQRFSFLFDSFYIYWQSVKDSIWQGIIIDHSQNLATCNLDMIMILFFPYQIYISWIKDNLISCTSGFNPELSCTISGSLSNYSRIEKWLVMALQILGFIKIAYFLVNTKQFCVHIFQDYSLFKTFKYF